MTAPVVDYFKEIRRIALECRFRLDNAQDGLEDAEVRDMVWDSAKFLRDAAKTILQICGDLRDMDLSDQTVDKEDVKSVYELIEGVAVDMVSHGTCDTYPTACREIILAARKIEELLEPSLRMAVVSGQKTARAHFVPHTAIPASDAYTHPTRGTPHPQLAFGSATTEDREAEASNLPDEVVGGDHEREVQKLEHLLHELRSNLPNADTPQIAATLSLLGAFHLPTGDMTQSKVFLEESLQMHQSLHCEQDHKRTACTLLLLGVTNMVQGNGTEAKHYLEESNRMFQSESGGTSDFLVGACMSSLYLGKLAFGKDPTMAKVYLEESLGIARSLCGSLEGHVGQTMVAHSLLTLGRLSVQENDLTSAKVHLQESSAIIVSMHGDEDHPLVASLLLLQGSINLQEGDLLLAKVCLQESLRKFQSLHGDKNHTDVADSLLHVGLLNLVEGDLTEAKVKLEKSLQMSLSLVGDEDHPMLAFTYFLLGKLALAYQDHMQARDYFERSLQINIRVFGDRHPPHPLIAEGLFHLSQFCP